MRPTVLAVVLCLALGACTGRLRTGAEAASSCDGSSTTVTVLASPGDFSEQLQARATAFMGSDPHVGGRCVRVVVTSKAPGAAVEAFDRGWDPRADGPAPDVWSPSSSAWVWLLQDQLDEAGKHPKEGTLLADHPYALLTTDPTRRAAAERFRAYLQSDEAQQALQRDGFRNRQVEAGGLLGEDGGILPDQPKVVMPLPDPEVIDLVLKGWPGLRTRGNVLALVDVSGSMNQPVRGSGASKLTLAKRAIRDSLGLFTDDDRLGLWQFSDQASGPGGWRELVPVGPLRAPFHGGVKREVIPRSVDGLRAAGGTALYDSVLAASRALRQRYQPGAVNLLLVISDGVDSNPRTIGLPALLARLQGEQGSRRVRIVTIAYGQDADRAALRRIAEASGGTAYQALDPKDIEEVLARAIAST